MPINLKLLAILAAFAMTIPLNAEDKVAKQASPDADHGAGQFRIETGKPFSEVESALRKYFVDKHPAFAALNADPVDVRQLNSPEYRRKIAELATASPVTSVINSFPGKPSRTIVERTELSDKEMSVVEIELYHNKDGTCRVDVQVEHRQKREGVSYAKTKSITAAEIRRVIEVSPADDDNAALQPGKHNASADEAAEESVTLKVVDADRVISRTVSNQTQIGFSNTKIFYTLAQQNAVVVVHLDDKDKKFAASGKIHLFAKDVSDEDLGKWVNNQHSDGLFANIPEPVATHTLSADAIKTVSNKLLNQIKGPGGATYEEHSVEFAAAETALTKTLKLAAFKDSATAYAKASAENKTGALKTLKGKRLLVGSPATDGVTWQGTENVGAFRKGAKQVGLHSPMANFDKGVGDFVAVIDIGIPLTQEQVDAYKAFAKQHPASTAPVLIIEFPDEKPKDQTAVKGRLIGVGNYPTGRAQNFTDADLRTTSALSVLK